MPAIAPVSDLRLQELADDPASDLFPLLTSPAAFAPWVVVLAFLPSLSGLFYWSLDERSADWGLRALASAKVSPTDMLWREQIETPRLIGAPPLATWLTRMLLVDAQLPMPLGLVGVSFLAVAVTVVFAARLSQRVGVPRLVPLTVLCCAGSPVLINSAHSASPFALGLCLLTISLERFLAHLDTPFRRLSGRLFVSALAWSGAWLAIGWPAFSLGLALTVSLLLGSHDPLGRLPDNRFSALSSRRTELRSLTAWWIIGLLGGGWWMVMTIVRYGWTQSLAWRFLAIPDSVWSPMLDAGQISRWGATAGLVFLSGWIVLGLMAILLHPKSVVGNASQNRGVILLIWWLLIWMGRVVSVATGSNPALWDVLQIIPACLTAAMGMELVIQRAASSRELVLAVIIGLSCLAIHLPQLRPEALSVPLSIGGLMLGLPILWSLFQFQSLKWPETRLRRVLQALVLSTWVAQLIWGVTQSLPRTGFERELAQQLAKLRESNPRPAAVVVVAPAKPASSLEFQLRRNWPGVEYVVADRWESAVTHAGQAPPDWISGECLLVELSPRNQETRRPGPEWTVQALSEPRRYHRSQLTFLSVHADRR